MNNDTLKKLLIGLVVLVVAFPAFMSFMPDPLTMEGLRAGFEAKGMALDDYHEVDPPGLEASRQVSMYINGAIADIYQYNDAGKLAKQWEYQKPGTGETVASQMGIAASLGAKTKEPPPFVAGKNGSFMIVTTGLSKPELLDIVRVFEGL